MWVSPTITPSFKGITMSENEQMRLISDMMRKAEQKGKSITPIQAMRKLHREYITRQLSRYGLKPKGFLIVKGFVGGEDDAGRLLPDPKIDSIFNSYLNMNNKLTGESGRLLRVAMDEMGIDYRNSPTFALDDLEENSA